MSRSVSGPILGFHTGLQEIHQVILFSGRPSEPFNSLRFNLVLSGHLNISDQCSQLGVEPGVGGQGREFSIAQLLILISVVFGILSLGPEKSSEGLEGHFDQGSREHSFHF